MQVAEWPAVPFQISAQSLDALGAPSFDGVLERWGLTRLFCAAFLHANLPHLFANLAALWILGTFLEGFIGSTIFWTIFILTSVGGSLCSILFQDYLTVGASGGITGLLGASLVLSRRIQELNLRKLVFLRFLPLFLFQVGTDLMMTYLGRSSIFGMIDTVAHLGGVISGVILGGLLLLDWKPFYVRPRHEFGIKCFGLFLGVVSTIAIGTRVFG